MRKKRSEMTAEEKFADNYASRERKRHKRKVKRSLEAKESTRESRKAQVESWWSAVKVGSVPADQPWMRIHRRRNTLSLSKSLMEKDLTQQRWKSLRQEAGLPIALWNLDRTQRSRT